MDGSFSMHPNFIMKTKYTCNQIISSLYICLEVIYIYKMYIKLLLLFYVQLFVNLPVYKELVLPMIHATVLKDMREINAQKQVHIFI